MGRKRGKPSKVTFIEQLQPVEEYGRALYAVARSILRAQLDSLSEEDLTDLNTPRGDVRMRQLGKMVRLERDKGIRGDGFEWAVHEAVMGGESRVTEPIHTAMKRASPRVIRDRRPTSLMFGQERARYLGFLDAVVDEAGSDAYLLPEGRGRPFRFGPWVREAARGKAAEDELPDRIKQVWKTDLFLSIDQDARHFAATVKSAAALIEGGRGLRIGIVPEEPKRGLHAGVSYDRNNGLWLVSLADPNGFMGLFNDAYNAVARAVYTMGKQQLPPYFTKPSKKAERVQNQLQKYPDAKVREVEEALNEAAQQKLVTTHEKLVAVNAPKWLHMRELQSHVVSPKPRFERL